LAASYRDATKIAESYQVEPVGIVDVSLLAIKFKLVPVQKSLSYLAKDLLNIKKSNSVGNWGKFNLSESQIKYASMDAWFGYMVGLKLHESLCMDGSNFFVWLNKYKPSLRDLKAADQVNNSLVEKPKPHHAEKFAQTREDRARKHVLRSKLEAKKEAYQYQETTERSLTNLVKQVKQNQNQANQTSPAKSNQEGKDDLILFNFIQ